MKTLLLALLLLLSGGAFAFDNCYSGSWYDPKRDGEGIAMQVLDELVVVYFYRPGKDNQRWYVMVGNRPDGDEATLQVYQSIGLHNTHWIGETVVSQTDENNLIFSYDFKFDFTREGENISIPWCIGCVDTFSYMRLTTPIPCD